MENDLIQAKLVNLEKLKALNVNPYPYKFDFSIKSTAFQEKYASLKNEEFSKVEKLSGRVMAKRSFGAIAFLKISDSAGMIQFFLRKGETPESVFKLLEAIDIGDIVGGEGKAYRTQRGELSIMVEKLTVLCKSILPLPEKFHGLQDIELRHRKRYLDLMMNPDVKEVFIKRSKIISAWREYLDTHGFLEVEIPTLQPTYGGASARPYTTMSNAWKSMFYLSISPELYLKRLLVGGYDKVYTVCKNFRNEDVDKTHNPEFTMSEFYWAYADLNDIMKLTEEMVEAIALKVNGTTKVNYQGVEVDVKTPWKRIKMIDALNKKAGIDAEKMSLSELMALAEKEGLEINADEKKKGLVIAELFEHFCEAELIQPTWVMEYPKETTPLCKPSRENPKDLIERTECYINGGEICNGYSELNDPVLQKQFFEEQKDQGKAKGENHPQDDDFLEAMGYGMPPAGGMGLGIDRLVMLLTNSATIREVIFFPQMKPESKQVESKQVEGKQVEGKQNETKQVEGKQEEKKQENKKEQNHSSKKETKQDSKKENTKKIKK
jgi:lysyl-tRNA synthetase class 2